MTVIEVLVAITVLVIGILGALTAFNASQRLSLVNERHAAMVQMAQREIERIESLQYGSIGLACGGSGQPTCPRHSSDPSNPGYYVSSDGGSFAWNRSAGTSEQLITPATQGTGTNGTLSPVQTWSQSTQGGLLSGSIYDFVTWTTDAPPPNGSSSVCSPGGCPATEDYKRITVAVTMSTGLQPYPVYVSSVMADPNAVGNNNPINSPTVNCTLPSGATGPCQAGLNNGNPNTFFLHDWAATNSGTPPAPSADHATLATVGATGTCTTSNTSGCPVPDLMDTNTPAGTTSTPVYNYSTDQCTPDASCYPGGRELQAAATGTDSSADCSSTAWSTSLANTKNELWVTPALGSSTTLTGWGGLSLYTQTLDGQSGHPLVSFCVEVYDVPPSGSAGSLKDIYDWPPKPVGGSGYVGSTDPTTGGNWPTSASQITFAFQYTQQNYTIAAGDRIGLRVWVATESPNVPIDLIYDNPNYPAMLQLNSQ
jgi:hypothetical protein